MPCAFFLSPDGCKNGDSCKFQHEKPENADVGATVVPADECFPVSSDGNETDEDPFVLPTGKSRKSKTRRSENSEPFAKPKKAKASAPIEENESTPSNNVKTTSPIVNEKTTPNAKPVDFRSLNLPVADWALPEASSHAIPKKETPQQTLADPTRNTLENPPLPKSSEEGRKWLDAVKASQQARNFKSDFNFKNEMAKTSAKWLKARPYGDWCKENPQIIAIDCEMCETQNPDKKEELDSNALCRVSIVDAVTDEVLLNSLVKPAWPVKDYRTFVNGITEESLRDVKMTLEHVQQFLLALCSEETVIVGHSLNNDLRSMKMEHFCVADSSLLFRAADDPEKTVSLADCAFSVMKTEMPKVHDSVNDARVALRCVQHYIEKKGKVEPVTRRALKARQAREAIRSQLVVHRIPMYIKNHQLEQMFVRQTKVAPESIDDIEMAGDGKHGKAMANFASLSHARLAFDSLSGKTEMDAGDRPQKRVYLRGGEYIWIRLNEKGRFYKKKGGKNTA